MNIKYTSADGRMTFTVDGETHKDLFREIAEFQSVFEFADTCGCCHSDKVRFNYRVVDDNAYYSLRCLDCTAEFKFGQHKKGDGLFPKLKDEEGKLLENRGWSIWRGAGTTAPPPPQRQAAQNRATGTPPRPAASQVGHGPSPHAPVDEEMPPF